MIDILPVFLSFVGIDIACSMTGIDPNKVWTAAAATIRENVIIENHQQPHSLYQKQLITERHITTTDMNHRYGKLFDLKNDPKELKNLWDFSEHSTLKTE